MCPFRFYSLSSRPTSPAPLLPSIVGSRAGGGRPPTAMAPVLAPAPLPARALVSCPRRTVVEDRYGFESTTRQGMTTGVSRTV